MNEVLADVEKARKEYEPLISPGEERKLANVMSRAWESYFPMSQKVMA
ncbi:MAG: hypothetical protein JWL84_2595 [Rhodospirillales bacterium]|nr:hypothetical protein [Rhodospirillales bacterium]